GKKFYLDLPLKVVLTEEGASHFISHKKKLLRFRLADNQEEYGISMDHFSPMSLQNMILVDYVSKLEISMSEFVSKRQEIMDLSKVIVYSILYKQFDREIFAALIQCDCVRRHNRSNPGQLIDEKTNISDKQLRNHLAMKENIIQAARQSILEPVWKSIMSNKDYTPEEKNIYLLMTEKFLNRLSLMNWYIITKFYKADGFIQIMSVIRQSLASYMDKSKVAEYISVMVMELALNCENTNMRKEARILYQGIENSDSLIYDPDIRSKIVQELVRKHEVVFLSWKIGGGSTSIGKQGSLNITLYNKDDEFQEVKENIENKMAADLNKKSLIDFYRQMPEGEEGTDLGLYYLSYLDDACKKVNVKFESLVNQFTASDLTVISLKFNF
ncbi:MAG: hypothetical protein J6Y16_01000, partial [Treponema sp.]|nr:hypothetical protein [Treponema sp.]